MNFQDQLKIIGYNPKTYLQQAQIKAIYNDYNYSSLQFSDDPKYKLQITNPYNGKVIRFGANGYNDYLVYMFLAKKRKISIDDANNHRNNFLARMKKKDNNMYSKLNLAREILW